MDKKTAKQVAEILLGEYPDARPALKFNSPYELLVAVILSAQCTDERVNKVTEKLFQVADDPQKMVDLGVEKLEEYIFSCGLYRSKADHIVKASEAIIEKFGGEIPSTLDELRTLSGVGRKTANVVYSAAFGGNAIAVDTHVFRVSARLGLAKGKNPTDTEKILMKKIPEDMWSRLHHALIYHGRRTCSARSPSCDECVAKELCEYFRSKNKAERG